jgi:hypothetical protein
MEYLLLGLLALAIFGSGKRSSNLGGFDPVIQTVHGIGPDGLPQGNCFPACIASIMKLPIDKVPFFTTETQGAQIDDANGWLRQFNLRLNMRPYRAGAKSNHCLARGVSPRFPSHFHMVVWKDDSMVHDPHPDQRGIIGKPTHLIHFEGIN